MSVLVVFSAASITHLVSVEMIEGPVSTFRMRTSVAVMWIEAVINVAVKVLRPMKPGAGSDEHPAAEPLGPIVSIRGAGVWGVIVVTIRTRWRWSDIDRDLSACRVRKAQQGGDHGGKGNDFQMAHVFLFIRTKATRMPEL
jgi:hypothetical protein